MCEERGREAGEVRSRMGGQRSVWALRATLLLSLGSCLLCVRTSDGSRGQLRLMTKTVTEGEVLPRPGASTREREIAAIFRGVAYGAPTTTTLTPIPPAAPEADQVLKALILPQGSTASGEGRNNNRSFLGPKAEYEIPSSKKGSYQVDIVPVSGGGATPGAPGPGAGQEGSDDSPGTVAPGQGGSVRSDTSVSTSDVRVSLGLAWWAHVYVSVGLYSLVAVASLCLLARAVAATRLLPRPHYFFLHLLIFLSASSRGLCLLHDAHTLHHLLPAAVLIALEDSGWPFLTAALAVMVVGVVGLWHHPRRPCTALTVALITVTHLLLLPVTHMTMNFLEPQDLPIMVTTRAAAVAWGSALGVGSVWAVWPASRGHPAQLTDAVGPGQESCHSVSTPAHVVLVGALAQLLLAALNLYVLVVPVTPAHEAWAWWCRLTLANGLEVLMGGMLLTAAALTISRPTQCCALNCYCCQKRTVEMVHPSSIKMIHPLGVYTLQQAAPKNEHAQTIAALSLNNFQKVKREHKSLDYVTSDFQLVWSHVRPLTASQTAGNLDAEDDVLQFRLGNDPDIPRAHILPLTPRNVIKTPTNPEIFTCSLPSYKLYAAVPESSYQFDEQMKASLECGLSHGASHSKQCATPLSDSSEATKLYSSPQVPLRASRSWDELSTSHIYEEPQRTFCGSVDEGLSDLSDVNGLSDLSDLPTDYLSDLLYSDTGSPLPMRPPQRSKRRHRKPCYVSTSPPLQHFIPTHHPTTTTSHQTSSQESKTRQSTKLRELQPAPGPAGSEPTQPNSAQPLSTHRKVPKTQTTLLPPAHRPLPPTQ
ncbi:uncharacterized protein [Procambarus clarkii]|uniref:uncharacterized protein n=1 Tax=Procambarus clarkii TaxID=6728 RepID=UPI00374368B9